VYQRWRIKNKPSYRSVLRFLKKEEGWQRMRARERPVLSEADIDDRLAFATSYGHYGESYWQRCVVIDNASMMPYCGKNSSHLARQRMTYQWKKQGAKPVTKPSSTLKINTGPLLRFTFGAYRGKQFFRPYIKWNGVEARAMYAELHRFCREVDKDIDGRSPVGTKRYRLVEDNDRTYKCAANRAWKARLFQDLPIPPRSPDFTVHDRSVFSAAKKHILRLGPAASVNAFTSRVRRVLTGPMGQRWVCRGLQTQQQTLKSCVYKGGDFEG
jgi:hypothetical protein